MIRPVRLSDAASIAHIYNPYVETTITFENSPVSSDQMRQRIEQIASVCPYFVYEQQGEVIGYCYVHPWRERSAYRYAVESTVYIAQHATNRGIGKALMLHLIEACRSRGYHTMIACITDGNEASCQLHRQLGFHQVARLEQVGWKADHWIDVANYELILT